MSVKPLKHSTQARQALVHHNQVWRPLLRSGQQTGMTLEPQAAHQLRSETEAELIPHVNWLSDLKAVDAARRETCKRA